MINTGELRRRFRSRPHVVDGGLATELEKRGHDISGKLWSAQVLLDAPDAIERLHYDYLGAGADIIITASYQLTFQGMQEAGYSRADAETAMHHSVALAVRARDRYLEELDQQPGEDDRPLIAASIGPYGAYLADGSEYRGDYGLLAADLAAFHRERFELLAASGADLIAFETTPDAREIQAYFSLLEASPQIPAWISASRMQAASAMIDCRQRSAPDNLVAWGANCIAPADVPDMIRLFKTPAADLPIIVYPNVGERWDAVQRRFTGRRDPGSFAAYAREWLSAGACLAGGCCGTGPEHIAGIRSIIAAL